MGLGNKSSSTAVLASGADTNSAAGSKRSAEASTATGALSRVTAASNSRNVKSKFMDTMLGGDSSSSDDEEDS